MARRTIHEIYAAARARVPGLTPEQAFAAVREEALLVDLRSVNERERHGVIPGSLHIPRSVLEWRVDPDSEHPNPAVSQLDARLILFCADGYSSALAAVSVHELGLSQVTDMLGGFTAWKAAGLPVRAAPAEGDAGLPGMGPID